MVHAHTTVLGGIVVMVMDKVGMTIFSSDETQS